MKSFQLTGPQSPQKTNKLKFSYNIRIHELSVYDDGRVCEPEVRMDGALDRSSGQEGHRQRYQP
jgi:hypothetical protein